MSGQKTAPESHGALGIVDYGIGGLGTYRAIKARADIPVIYFSDAGFTPYGKLLMPALRARLYRIFDFLHAQGAQYIAVACNAASCALPKDEHVEGIIKHGARAVRDSGLRHVGLIAGERTVRSGAYRRALQEDAITLTQRIAQPLSLHVEAGRLNGSALRIDLEHILNPLRNCQAILLACTHYPAIARHIQACLHPDTLLLDPSLNLAEWIVENWNFEPGNTPDRWFTSGDPIKLAANGRRAFGVTARNPVHTTL